MKKANIEARTVVDRIALCYADRDQGGTYIEVIVKTRADIGERVLIEELGAQRNVLRSRWLTNVKVVLITADEWRYLRGTVWVEPRMLGSARQLSPPTQ